MTYKILNILSLESFSRKKYSSYETRNCKDLQIPRLISENAIKRFSYSALKAWNDILANIREIMKMMMI